MPQRVETFANYGESIRFQMYFFTELYQRFSKSEVKREKEAKQSSLEIATDFAA